MPPRSRRRFPTRTMRSEPGAPAPRWTTATKRGASVCSGITKTSRSSSKTPMQRSGSNLPSSSRWSPPRCRGPVTTSMPHAPAAWAMSIPSASIPRPSPRTRPGPTLSTTCASGAARKASASAIGARARKCARSRSSPRACRPGAQPRVVLIGRLSLYGDAAARLHEEIIPVTAVWSEAGRPGKALRALAQTGEATTMQQVEVALNNAKPVPAGILKRLAAMTPHDVHDLLPALGARAEAALADAGKELGKRGAEEAKSLHELLEQQRKRIEGKAAEFDKAYDPNAPMLPGLLQEELAQMRADRRHWNERLARLAKEVESEPARLRQGYEVKAHRLEPVGLLFLWPVTG